MKCTKAPFSLLPSPLAKDHHPQLEKVKKQDKFYHVSSFFSMQPNDITVKTPWNFQPVSPTLGFGA